MPIHEEEKASGKPAAKARPTLKPSSTSGWDSTLMEQRHWIDILTQESKDPHCFQVSKFITRILRHSKQVRRRKRWWSPLRPNYWYRTLVRRTDAAIRPCSALVNCKWISVLAKDGGQKKRFQYCLNPNYSQKFLYPRGNPRTFRKHNQSCIARQFTDTKSFYRIHWSRLKRKRIEVKSWFDSRRTQSHNKQTCCVLHCCESDG